MVNTARVVPISGRRRATSQRDAEALIDRISTEDEAVLLSHLNIVTETKAAILKSAQRVRALLEGRGTREDVIHVAGEKSGALAIDIPNVLQRLSAAAERVVNIERKARGMDRAGAGEQCYEDRLADFLAAAQEAEPSAGK